MSFQDFVSTDIALEKYDLTRRDEEIVDYNQIQPILPSDILKYAYRSDARCLKKLPRSGIPVRGTSGEKLMPLILPYHPIVPQITGIRKVVLYPLALLPLLFYRNNPFSAGAELFWFIHQRCFGARPEEYAR
ncbi:hypothetical protein FJZ31_19130 [Candidatus Poribacteria bacterium]|nr:hypothetical protein [Candidatus Poribacteria bacterium]